MIEGDSNKKEKKFGYAELGTIEYLLIAFSVIFILFSFLAPNFLIGPRTYHKDFTTTGSIGDTIGGLMNPFIAISGVLITFLAFRIQYIANRIQIQIVNEETKKQTLVDIKSQIEKQFYEMLRLHKDNVNDIRLNGDETSGRNAFKYILNELELCYQYRNLYPEFDIEIFKKAYYVIFIGINRMNMSSDYKDLIKLKRLAINKTRDFYSEIELKGVKLKAHIKGNIFEGYSSNLSHYYRHLFQTVKYIVNQDETILGYKEKRNYLRILRAQLTNEEQVLLFYNWLAGYGYNWENKAKNNFFFSDYRMIHNIPKSLLFEGIEIENYFRYEDHNLRKEDNRNDDCLFEFQEELK